jgi:hypothetical protein
VAALANLLKLGRLLSGSILSAQMASRVRTAGLQHLGDRCRQLPEGTRNGTTSVASTPRDRLSQVAEASNTRGEGVD